MFDFSLCFRHNPFDRFFADTRLDNLLVFLLPQPHFDAEKFRIVLIEVDNPRLFQGYVPYY